MKQNSCSEPQEADEEPCILCQPELAAAYADSGPGQPSVCLLHARQLAAHAGWAAVKDIEGRWDKLEAAWQGVAEFSEAYWGEFRHDDDFDYFVPLQWIDRLREELSDARLDAERAEQEAEDEVGWGE